MATKERLRKNDLDYFPLEININQDSKILLLEGKFGLEGFAVLIKLYIKIYGDKGYYCEWNEVEKLLFARMLGIDADRLDEIISTCIKFKIFDKKMYEKYSILTSKGIQERFFFITSRRKKINVENSYLLINCEEYRAVENSKKTVENSKIQTKDVKIQSERVNKQTKDVFLQQSKVKESKVNDLIKDKGVFSQNVENFSPLLGLLVETDYIDVNTSTRQLKQFNDLFFKLEKDFDFELIKAATSYVTRFVKRNNVSIENKVAYLKTALMGNLDWLSEEPKIYKTDEEYYQSIYNKLSLILEKEKNEGTKNERKF